MPVTAERRALAVTPEASAIVQRTDARLAGAPRCARHPAAGPLPAGGCVFCVMGGAKPERRPVAAGGSYKAPLRPSSQPAARPPAPVPRVAAPATARARPERPKAAPPAKGAAKGRTASATPGHRPGTIRCETCGKEVERTGHRQRFCKEHGTTKAARPAITTTLRQIQREMKTMSKTAHELWTRSLAAPESLALRGAVKKLELEMRQWAQRLVDALANAKTLTATGERGTPVSHDGPDDDE